MRNELYGLFGLFPLMLACSAIADAPARPNYFYVTCSKQSRYCAAVSPADGIKVFKVVPRNSNTEPTYSVSGWYAQVFVSDDGRRLVTVGATIIPDAAFDQPVVNCWLDGKPFKQYLVRDLVGRLKLSKTTSGFHWGDAIGFDDEGKFLIRLDDQSIVDIRF